MSAADLIPSNDAIQDEADHRTRLITAMGTTLVVKPYADITIADVVAAARVSKRTFYEQFESKEACLLALCERLSERTLTVMSEGFNQIGRAHV